MDAIDVNILKLLKENSRISASEISSKINLSIPAVSDRLKKLDASGVIEKYTIIISNKKMNKNITVIMFISLKNPNFTDKFVEFIQNENEIIECHYLTGDFDYALKIVTEDTETLEKILNEIKLIKGVLRTKTIVTLSTIKNNYSIPPDEI
ncbi:MULTISPECIES: Lrp/AsnC family transcriptional regulator [Clostridium]|uniref:Leucine-responsive regulatory protein n=3 Tax=Clostridium TaxID=1485 RepID=D8GJK4_CLOLD|nr:MULTISPECIES: Lrp/AsnC family transcriptional regulator [Clostridium]ADK15165.1 predicted transcriptional regulator, Lrp family [Clostridium ljungdahlii DSM 13528]AGY74423.1 Lrp/AsnC family transcriptional regulator [Clostridium autoethanogenum DSM 10061]ALU34611.1 Transcriptional regulator AsnC family [Clostridium autoethanogenum DSM 10061]OAA88644.1 Leucine-responsive regulatory protein [Clostridium ljungdahlii DSM 13528]OVY51331.1 Leucine-responsive regulatory protein [Clostridium autoet